MQRQKYYIKGMVCQRCISSVKQAFQQLGMEVLEVGLGEVTIVADAGVKESRIIEQLTSLGFSLLQDKRIKLLKDTKALVAEVYSGSFDFPLYFRFSAFAAEQLSQSYDAISANFTAIAQTSLEKYIIDFRISKVKELLVYTDMTLADISFVLGFSSVAHLSKQFKSHTGLNPSHFKEIKSIKQLKDSKSEQ